MRKLGAPIVVLVVALLISGGILRSTADDYNVSLVLPNANNLFVGGSVTRDGSVAGSIRSIDVEDGKARVNVKLDKSYGPLHEGAKADVVWKAMLGERLLRIEDGPAENVDVPSGAMLTGVMAEPVELSEVLEALDEPTRKSLNSVIKRLSETIDGREQNINETLHTAGPALKALGTVLREIGTDGVAIKQLVTQLNRTMTILSDRDAGLDNIVNDLSATTSTLVTQRQALGKTLHQLPGLVGQAETTLSKVPGAVDETVPLLEDLGPATNRLQSVSKNLRPLLRDLRPTVTELRPTLDSAAELLRYTPSLLDMGSETFPAANNALSEIAPALDFLRPYTPEVAGFLTTWASATGNYDANGHTARIHILAGTGTAVGVTSTPGPGVTQNLTPKPGSPVGQPWEDAYGSEMR